MLHKNNQMKLTGTIFFFLKRAKFVIFSVTSIANKFTQNPEFLATLEANYTTNFVLHLVLILTEEKGTLSLK